MSIDQTRSGEILDAAFARAHKSVDEGGAKVIPMEARALATLAFQGMCYSLAPELLHDRKKALSFVKAFQNMLTCLDPELFVFNLDQFKRIKNTFFADLDDLSNGRNKT